MQTTATRETAVSGGLTTWFKNNSSLLAVTAFMLFLPFLLALIDGQPLSSVMANDIGNSRFMQGLLIEIFIMAIYAISYDLILGITGLLSFGHAMFFAVGAYTTGILIKSLGWGIFPALAGVLVAGILQALLFGLVLPRVKGITFALVTLGLASVFQIVVASSELADYTGADVGLQGIIIPDWINTSTERFRLYVIALLITLLVYIFYRRFVDSPTGRVCVAIRENENRALMLGYNTFYFKLVALIISSMTAALAGFLHTIHQPIVSPSIATLGWTVAALLIILIGGIGTLSGALVGAAVFRLLEFYLDRWFGDTANSILGLVYIILVMFIPYGIVGTWRTKQLQIQAGRNRLRQLLLRK